MLPINTPEREPLLDLAPDHVADFMWMFVVELEDGTRVQAYKHRWTRRYLLLGRRGQAFIEVAPERYQEVAAGEAFLGLLEDEVSQTGYYFVPQNESQAIQLRWARSATKHRISRQRSKYVIEHCGAHFRRLDAMDGGPRILFLGDDAEGVALEIVAVEERRESFAVIHAMGLRQKYRVLYERGRQWGRK